MISKNKEVASNARLDSAPLADVFPEEDTQNPTIPHLTGWFARKCTLPVWLRVLVALLHVQGQISPAFCRSLHSRQSGTWILAVPDDDWNRPVL